MIKFLAQNQDNPFGQINPPAGISKYGGADAPQAIGQLLNIVLKALIVGAGVYALINIILAGYAFMSAGDDAKKIEGAWAKIWQTIIGLAVAAGAFVIAAVIGQLIFGDAKYILSPSIPTQ